MNIKKALEAGFFKDWAIYLNLQRTRQLRHYDCGCCQCRARTTDSHSCCAAWWVGRVGGLRSSTRYGRRLILRRFQFSTLHHDEVIYGHLASVAMDLQLKPVLQ